MESDTPSTTPQTSSESSTSNPQDPLDLGSESEWRDRRAEDPRPIFYMGDDDAARYAASGFGRNIEGQKIKVGICAMSKKTHSKPMKEIMARLEKFDHLQLMVFEEDLIVNQPVEEWPVVDSLISFFSTGFPLDKAIQYKNLHKPYVVNDLEAQYSLKDRREVYKILAREGISHPRYAVMNREEDDKGDFEESEDAIEVNTITFQRPFVEKPVNAEDHNIYIYFPMSAGGGCQRLFRKVGSRSSVYCTLNRVRKAGSYIYEDFMPTDGTDVKVYTVGPDYAHAEARKSPALDGKVERDKDGKEVRYPVLLNAAEKLIARKVCQAFKQNVCGFDLLRTGGCSFVCDVNGFSFVKNSTKYYDDCANVLGTMIVRALAPQLHIPLVLGAAPEDLPVVPTTSGSMMELRCVIAVIRHGDRTPKQKMKMEVKHRRFFELFEKYNGYKKGHLKFKKPKQLQEVLDIARELLDESHHDANPEVLEKKAKLQQLKLVLEMYGHFSGINRKVQLKYQPHGAPKHSSSEEGLNCESTIKYEFTGINRKIQLKYQPYGRPPTSSDDEHPREPSLVLIVKWGGELTPAGKYQAEDLGKAFRTLYPGGQGEYDTPGLGFLRLHSTFRHDLKIYASDEGRVQMTAAAFTKGLLALEGELPPILVSMVKSANTNGLLDKEGETSKYQHIVKERLMDMLNQDQDFTQDDYDKLAPTKSVSQISAMNFIKNPRKLCERVYTMVQEITSKVRSLKLELISRDLKLYHGESWELLIRRWGKLEKDFRLKTGDYDISKIPDIYDCIKYDLQHNQKTLQFSRAEELFACSKALADIVIPQEYGITVEEKLHISQSICTPLMRKIHSDLIQARKGIDEESTRLNSKYSKGVASPERFVRTRLYFTSESHIHSLLNMMRYGGFCDENKDEQWRKAMDFLSTTAELNYMTQINIMMFEDPTKDSTSPERFHIELHFSPGAYTSCDKTVMAPSSSGYRTSFFTRQEPFYTPCKKSLDADPDSAKPENVISEAITEESISDEITPPDGGEMAITINDEAKNILKDTPAVAGTSKDGASGVSDERSEGKDSDGKDKQESSGKSGKSGAVAAGGMDAPAQGVLGAGMVVDGENDADTSSKETLEPEVFDEKSSDDEHSKTLTEAPKAESSKAVPGPRSPDPDIPEWDWGDTSNADKQSSQSETTLKCSASTSSGEIIATSLSDTQLSPKSCSKPIAITSHMPYKARARKGSFDSIQSLDEKRSRSLEDDKNGCLGRERRPTNLFYPFRYSHSDVFTMGISADVTDTITMMEQHYRTIHLPINKDCHHSVSSLLYLNPDAFKDWEIYYRMNADSHELWGLRDLQADIDLSRAIVSYSAPQLSENYSPDGCAFDGFNMVPSLKPLETLHNTLTMRDMDAFLSRATTTKFFTPVSSPMFGTTPLPSPRPELNKARSTCSGPSLPSSSNSSAGPSSPTSASTPTDFLTKLKMFIIDKNKQEGATDVDATESESSQVCSPSTAGSQVCNPVAGCSQSIASSQTAGGSPQCCNPIPSSSKDVGGSEVCKPVPSERASSLGTSAKACSPNTGDSSGVSKATQGVGGDSSSSAAGQGNLSSPNTGTVVLVPPNTSGVANTAETSSTTKPTTTTSVISGVTSPIDVPNPTAKDSNSTTSAFRVVARSSERNSQFHVHQVRENVPTTEKLDPSVPKDGGSDPKS